MINFRIAATALVVSASLVVLTASASKAQSTEAAAASTPSKADAKAQRKADRKAVRSKRDAELKILKKNGHQPGGGQLHYPQNLQDTDKNSTAEGAKAASSQ
jgi:hypothetical protein